MKEENISALKEYVERTKYILNLASPQLDGIDDAESYREVLLSTFDEIKELADKNNETLDPYLKKLADKGTELSAEDIEIMREFCSLLVDTTAMESIDLPIIQMQTERILEAAEKTDDIKTKLVAYDEAVASAYMMLNLTIRLYPESDICFHYRDLGLDACRHILEYLDKDKFMDLPDEECKELVLVDSRYIRSLFDWLDKEEKEEYNEHDLAMMRRALEISKDPFYINEVPNYNWDVHIFRTLQYLADFTEYHNGHGYNLEQLKEITSYTRELIEFIKKHPELEERCSEVEQNLYLLRNTYLSKEINIDEYKDGLLHLMKLKDNNDFSARSMFLNFIIPYEYILTLKDSDICEEEYKNVSKIYEEMVSYVYRMPKSGTLSFMLTFLSEVLKNFIEVPGGITIGEMCLRLIAAIHPITYVHTLSVANITSYLTRCLLDKNPELYIGLLNTKDIEEVINKKEEIVDFAYKSALLHDVGKLFIVETIITYGRHLVADELNLIRIHPSVGAALLAKYDNTKDYQDAAKGHHKYFNNEGGYPRDFDLDASKNKIIVSALTVADCLDAATDRVGRNYKMGKKLSSVMDELEKDIGVRYDPNFVSLIRNDDNVYDGIVELITKGRDENYRTVYHILKEL